MKKNIEKILLVMALFVFNVAYAQPLFVVNNTVPFPKVVYTSGGSATAGYTITNNMPRPLNITCSGVLNFQFRVGPSFSAAQQLNPADFTYVPCTQGVAPACGDVLGGGGSCGFCLVYRPTAAGEKISGNFYDYYLPSGNYAQGGTVDTSSTNIPANKLTISPNLFVFNSPGSQTINVTNNTLTKVHIDAAGATFSQLSGLALTIPSGSACGNLPSGQTCTLSLTATQDAYGDNGLATTGQVNIPYTLETVPTVFSAAVSAKVKQANLLFSPAPPIILQSGKESTISVTVDPTDFTWFNANFINNFTGSGFDDPKNHTTCTGNLSPGSVCTVGFVPTCTAKKRKEKKVNVSPAGNLVFTGDHAVSQPYLISLDSLDITIDTEYPHVSYRAIKITNSTSTKYIISVDDSSLNHNYVKYCVYNPLDATCDYKTDLACSGGTNTLDPQKSCLVWFKAENKNTEKAGAYHTPSHSPIGNVTIKATSVTSMQNGCVSKVFDFDYYLDLYAGGQFGGVTEGGGGNAH